MTAIVSVPRRLLLTSEACLPSLGRFFARNEQLFDGHSEDDNEYNMLACFLVHELAKGPGSPWYPYLRSIGATCNMTAWGIELVSADSRRLMEEACYFREEVQALIR
jgi:hypothetical protein